MVEVAEHILSNVSVTGSFSLAEMNAWVSSCLPEIPDRCTEDSITHIFESTFIGTVLVLTYSKGQAQFQSDNISALQILKEVLSLIAFFLCVFLSLPFFSVSFSHCLFSSVFLDLLDQTV